MEKRNWRSLSLRNLSSSWPTLSSLDLGLSKSVGQTMLMTLCGTRAFLASEILDAACTLGTGKYINKVDTWGLGVILFKLLF